MIPDRVEDLMDGTQMQIESVSHTLMPPVYRMIAARSPYLRDMSNGVMFTGEYHCAQGWFRVGVELPYIEETAERRLGKLLGFTVVRHKVRSPITELYFIGTREGEWGRGIGQALIRDLQATSPHRAIELNVMKENEQAVNFYLKYGFVIAGESMKGKSHRMRLDW